MNLANVGANQHELFLRGSQVFFLLAIRVAAHPRENGLEHFIGSVEDRNAAVFEFGGELRVEQEIPAIERSVSENFLDLGLVVADASRTPEIWDGVLIVRIVQTDTL